MCQKSAYWTPLGGRFPAQVRATSYWEDDSIRWALLDFNVDTQPGQKTTYRVECGQGVKRSQVEQPLRVKEEADLIRVDTGPLQFTVSKERFRLFENVLADGKPALSGSPTLQVTEDTGKRFTTSGETTLCCGRRGGRPSAGRHRGYGVEHK